MAMYLPFAVVAVSRLDGSSEDGMHLLWTAPPDAGYSVKGFDIQRRPAHGEQEVSCYTLSPDELLRLHQDLRIDIAIARIGMRRCVCPDFPTQVPDEPTAGIEPGGACADFRESTPGRGPNPRVENGISFQAAGSERTDRFTEIRKLPDGSSGLHCGHRMQIELPVVTDSVVLTIEYTGEPPIVTVFQADGASAGTQSPSGPPGELQAVDFSGTGLKRVVIEQPTAHETAALVASLCYRIVGDALGPGRPSKPAYVAGLPAHPPVAAWAVTGNGESAGCWLYDIDLRNGFDRVRVTAGLPAELAIALRQGKAVDARMLNAPPAPLQAEFDNRGVDWVKLYTNTVITSLTICVSTPQSQEQEDKEWSTVPYLVKLYC
jgi:hypothetical protein